ncbi:MAG: TIGR03936 family radical SAM-associated protein [Lachnospiraceae bacterium]
MKIRVKYKKYGPVKFIGHLDMMRYFQKAIRRAEIDIAYSSGFSPHQIMSFAAPLGVGMESNGEYFDIELHSHKGSVDFVKTLNNAMANGIEVLSATKLEDTTINAMASVAAASYTILPKDNSTFFEQYEEQVANFYAQEEILMEKKTKKGSKIMDLKQGIYSLVAKDNAITMFVDASSAGNIKPIMVLEAIFLYANIPFHSNNYQIIREETFAKIEKEGQLTYVPLSEIGVDF